MTTEWSAGRRRPLPLPLLPPLLLLLLLLAVPPPLRAEHVREFEVSEGVPAGTSVGFIGRAVAGPRPPEPPYWIVPVPGSAVDSDLSVNESTGQVRTRVVLDREVRSSYSLVAIPQSGENIRVVIRVKDANDNAPTFPVETTAIEFPENTRRDVKRTLFPARDLDLGVFNTQRYNIVSGNVNNAFRLSAHRERDGVLYLDLQINGILDRETTAFYSLVIEALDGGSPPLRGSMTVNITIQDVNDNQPIFNQSRYFATIAENATIGSSVLQVFATDTDSGANGRVTYSINRRQSDRDSMFKIDPDTGVISVNRPLDFEAREVHELVVVARDSGAQPLETTAFVSIRVSDVNDNLPNINLIFLSDDASPKIAEDAQPGEFVARISVNDPDTKEEYDNISVNVTLSGGDGHFGLTTRDSIIYLVMVSRPLDRELKPNYTLTVRATDQGTPPLVAARSFDLVVTDTNDNAPRFERAEYRTSVLEVADPGTEVLQVTAVDSDEGTNSQVLYAIVPDEDVHSEWFEIGARTGLITTKAHVDCETEPESRLTVVATDGGSPPLSATVSVLVTIVDVNDNEPLFDQSFYNVTVAEDQSVGHCILKVSATDPDCGVNAQVNYTIGHGFRKKFSEFTIQPKTGDICIASRLDRERRSIYEFPVVAMDRGGLSTTAMVKVQVSDVNDNRPTFYPRQYKVSVQEDELSSSPLVVVVATDQDSADSGQVRYAIVGGNSQGLFRVDANSGEVFVTQPLSQSATVHQLEVEAIDGGGLKSLANAVVALSVIEPGQRPPRFESARYLYSVREDAAEGAEVGAVRATAGQTGGEVRYSIYSGDPGGWFSIEAESGVIRTAGRLDHEQHAFLLLNVQATSGQPPTHGHTQVNVTVDDVNDVAPEFDAQEATLSLPENTALRTAIYAAHASDHDSGENGRVRYRLLRNPDGVFAVDADDGTVSLAKAVDYERRRAYTLVIAAADAGAPPLSANLTLRIDVQDFNDNAPAFERAEYETSVRENLPVNAQLLQLTASDADTGNNARLTYRLLEPPGELFGIFPNSGWLYLRGQLDREAADQYNLTVQVTDNGTPSKSARTRAVVRVLDVNDHAPEFSRETYEFSVSENMAVGTVVGTLAATDRDLGANASLRYSLNLTNGSFRLDPRTGVVRTAVELDRELIELYEFSAEVSDEGSPPRRSSTVIKVRVLDDNDSEPRFLEPLDGIISVREGQQAGFEVVQVHATDADLGENATITYSFAADADDGNDGAFTIDSVSGVISTTRELDHEVKAVYRLEVVARDGGARPRQVSHPITISVLDLNDNSPTFTTTSLSFIVQENVPIGYQVGTVEAIDRDAGENGRVSYTILSGNLNDTFDINRSTGALITTREVDYEMAAEYLLQIEAVDASATNPQNSKIAVTVTVSDVNDNAPVFADDLILFSVAEDTAPGSAVWNFSATDSDSGPAGTVRYSLSQQSPEPVFAIDQYTGSLTLRDAIDYEVHAEYTIIVTATDQSEDEPSRLSTSVTSQIIVEDVNDHAPVFVRAAGDGITVQEDERVGYPVLHVIAIDKDSRDNGRVTYHITDGDPDGVFSLHEETGLLSIGKRLDRESRKQYRLNVTASDHGQPPQSSSVTVRITVEDVNDNQPIFSRSVYYANVSERAPVGSFVVRVSAADRDEGTNGNPTYYIPEGIAGDAFVIDSGTGEMRTAARLDRETVARHVVTVYASDGSVPPQSDATSVVVSVLDENDHSPEFRGSCYPLRVPENEKEAVIHAVVAVDDDSGSNGEITYTITDGNTGNKFSIDARTGALSAGALDREERDSYRLEVTAQDRGSPSRRATCDLRVRVQDQNDNDPVFQRPEYQARIPEDASLGSDVITVQAADADAGLNGRITYSLNNETQWRFRIDNVSGKITTAGSFNREQKSTYTFEVQATDGGQYEARSTRATVTVVIEDANDHAPVLARYPFAVRVPAYTQQGAQLVTVEADDSDLGANGAVTYSFANQPANSLFRIHPDTGVVKAIGSLGKESGRLFHLEVIARDQGTPPRSAAGLVEISVGEGRHTSLHFQNDNYRAEVPENAPAGSDVIQVTAVRSDGRRQRITYSFGSGNEDGTFEINANNGLIRVRGSERLDYELSRSLRLIVVAQAEGTTPLYGYTTVHVDLLDSNDNEPRFTQDEYVSAVWEGNRKGTFVVQVSATDADTGINANVVYSIVEGNLDNAFIIETPYSGVVRTNIVLDREIRGSYDLKIIATDQGRPALMGSCSLHIKVIDINDNRPTFPPHSVISVSEGTQVGAVVTTVTANDVDTNPALTYSFAGGVARHEAFTIDRFTGQITLVAPLDRETRQQYVLGVAASDAVHLAETNVTINVLDVNDESPVFSESSYTAGVLEMSGPGVEVLRLSASDRDLGDNSRLTFYMLTRTQHFYVEPATGVLFTNGTARFEPGQPARHLVVAVRDAGQPPRSAVAAVRIVVEDINNHAPEFEKSVYRASISEDTPLGHVILKTSAEDVDESRHNRNIDYSFISGNEDGMFQIASTSGEVILLRPLDREQRAQYVLEAAANDRGTPARNSTARVIIDITDVNDHEPKFNQSEYTASVSELAQVGTSVLRVHATDRDSGQNSAIVYDITSGNDQQTFQLDGNSGMIRLGKRLDFDRLADYRLIVRATDLNRARPLSALATVHVRVLDENDNAPSFPQPVYFEFATENEPPGRLVFTAHANDADRGRYGRLNYTLTDDGGWFRVDPATGDVTTAAVFDYEARDAYAFTVIAADPGGRSATAQVRVTVRGVDEFAPVFTEPTYRLRSPADAQPGYVVGRVAATDRDRGADGLVLFRLRTSHQFFRVNKTSGQIVVRRSLGERRRTRRDLSSERLEVVASSGRPGSLSALASVEVVLDPALNGTGVPAAAASGGLADWGVGLLVAIVLIVMAFGAAFVFLHMRNRRLSKPTMPDHFDSSFDTDMRAGPPADLHYPPRYSEIGHPYDSAVRPAGRNTTSELSEQSHRSASSGRGSAEDGDEDEEIRMINEGPLMQQKLRQLAVPDARLRDDDNVSEASAQNTQEYLARLGIDTTRSDSHKGSQSLRADSTHLLDGEPVAASAAVDLGNLISSKLTAAGAEEDDAIMDGTRAFAFDETQPSMTGSLSSIVHSEEELTGSYNWDYLLNWGPQYQPLAHVFSEIARLKDDSAPSPYAVSAAKRPPPLLTNVAPRSVAAPVAPRSSLGLVTMPSLPRSPIAHDAFAAQAMSPSFSPALSPLATRSPSMSPHVPRGLAASAAAAAAHHRSHLLAGASSSSESELRI